MAKKQQRRKTARRSTRPSSAPRQVEVLIPFWRNWQFIFGVISVFGVLMTWLALADAKGWWPFTPVLSYKISSSVVMNSATQLMDFNLFGDEMYEEGLFVDTAQLWVEVLIQNTGDRVLSVENLIQGISPNPDWGNPNEGFGRLIRDGEGVPSQEIGPSSMGNSNEAYRLPNIAGANVIPLPLIIEPGTPVRIYTPFYVPISKDFPSLFYKGSPFRREPYLEPKSVLADLITTYHKIDDRREWLGLHWIELFSQDSRRAPLPNGDVDLNPWYSLPLYVEVQFLEIPETRRETVEY